MEAILKMRKKGDLTIPAKIRKIFGLEPGDFVEVETSGDAIILHPRKMIDPTQAYFWTAEWQEGEKEAEEDIRKGRVKTFASAEEGIKYLRSGKTTAGKKRKS